MNGLSHETAASVVPRFRGRVVGAEAVRRDVPLRKTLRGRDGPLETRRIQLLRLTSDDGVTGLGEASAVTWLSEGESDSGDAALDALVERIRSAQPLAEELSDWSVGDSRKATIQCALSTALLDLESRRAGMSAIRLLRPGDRVREVPVAALLGDADASTMAAEASRLAARGYSCFKIKVGKAGLAEDAVCVAAVRSAIGPQASIRLDANGAWNVDQARNAFERFAASAPDFIEEPLRDPTEVAELKFAHRVALDESITTARELEAAIERRGFRVLVLKLERVGGPLAALEMAGIAARAGLEVVFTDSIESAVGRAATLHTAVVAAGRAGTSPWPVGLGGLFFLGDGADDGPLAKVLGPGLGVDPSVS